MEFNLDAIDKSFTKYTRGELLEGVVIQKRDDGVIFNIGGKSDAFIPRDDFQNFDAVKMGDRFKVVITKTRNEEGMIECSKSLADDLILGSQKAESIKLGSRFSFVVSGVKNNGLVSKLGQYEIFIPEDEISSKYVGNLKKYISTQREAIATEINREQKYIIGSIKMLVDEEEKRLEDAFWKSIFINKIVSGKVVRIVPFGAFVNVDGVDCLLHLSDLSYDKISSADEVVKVGETYQFRVVKVDKENKKVSVGLKQLQDDPKVKRIKELKLGETYDGTVVKILPFGAIIRLENGAEGLLHVSDASNLPGKRIYELVKLDESVRVVVKSLDVEERKVSFKLA